MAQDHRPPGPNKIQVFIAIDIIDIGALSTFDEHRITVMGGGVVVGLATRSRSSIALAALEELCETEGILTALETSHAYVAAREWARENPGKRLLIGNSGRGDKDMPTLTKYPVRTRSHDGT